MFMGIAQKHWYRFGFLKSDEWKDFRLVALVHYGERCYACKCETQSLDIHHLWYPGRKIRVWDARPLCRKCHDAVHSVTQPKEYKDIEEALAAFYQFIEDRWEIPDTLKPAVREREELALERKRRNIEKMQAQQMKSKKRKEERAIESPEEVREAHRKDIVRLENFLLSYRNGTLTQSRRDVNLSKWLAINSQSEIFREVLREQTGMDIKVLTQE